MPKRLTTEEFISKAKIIHGDKYDYSYAKYIDSRSLISIRCIKHNHIFIPMANNHLKGTGCKMCANEAQSFSTSEFITRCNDIHDNKYKYDNVNYTGTYNHIEIYCPVHKSYFNQLPKHHLAGHGCPLCNTSKGERMVELYLNTNDIFHYREYKFKKCKHIKQLPFDFYIPHINLLIEYDGEQHFTPIKHFGGVMRYNETVRNDQIKNKFTISHDIRLIRIPHYNFNDIDIILENAITNALYD